MVAPAAYQKGPAIPCSSRSVKSALGMLLQSNTKLCDQRMHHHWLCGFATAGQDFIVTQSRLHEMLSKKNDEVYASNVSTYIFEGLV